MGSVLFWNLLLVISISDGTLREDVLFWLTVGVVLVGVGVVTIFGVLLFAYKPPTSREMLNQIRKRVRMDKRNTKTLDGR